jgi:hypothetical protein
MKPCKAGGIVAMLAVMVAACTGSPQSRPSASAGHEQPGGIAVGSITVISQGSCGQQDAEVEAAAWHDDVYVAWICLVGHHGVGIGFARSADGGRTWSAPVVMPGSSGGWDPAVAVAPDGTLYVSFMASTSRRSYPVVDVSQDRGRTFPRSTRLVPALPGNFGDRDFIAAGASGVAYVTWDYGPSAAKVRTTCERGGSCSFAAGDLNIVIQKSTDYGQHWGPPEHVSPGFPAGGADLAPLLIGPGGRVDVTYQAFRVLRPDSLALAPSNIYFTSSRDGGATWSRPVLVGAGAGTISTRTWWIDGAIAADAAGNLSITWDTQGTGSDTGWLSYSTDGGQAWSAPIRVTPDNANVPHIVQPASSTPGTVDVGWLSDSSPSGYAQYLRVFSLARGWLGAPVEVSRQFGLPTVWPGDTFGIADLSASTLVLAWGSAPGLRSQIYAAPVSVTQ